MNPAQMFADGLHMAVAFVAVLSVIVFIHEFGHYYVARLCGVKVEAFSIGFGKELFGKTDKHGTRWKVCLIPMGGYVKMYGDAGPESSPDGSLLNAMTPEQKEEAFHYKPLYKKAAVVGAGPFANFVLTIVVLSGLFMAIGKQTSMPMISQVMAGSAAEKAGLKPGDEFLTLGGEEINEFADIQRYIGLHLGEEAEAKIKRGQEELTLTLKPEIKERKDIFGNVIKLPQLGVMSGPEYFSYNRLAPLEAIGQAFAETGHFVSGTLTAVGQMITGKRDASEISGPIGIARLSAKTAEQGLSSLLWFVAILSANLGLVNLFPVPALDGGHLLFYGLEALRGRPMAERFQEYGSRAGVALIAVFAVFAVYNDLRKLFSF